MGENDHLGIPVSSRLLQLHNKQLMGFESQVHEHAYRNHPLTEAQKQSNRSKSKTHARVEHVFGAWVVQMGGNLVRSIGLLRAKATLGLKNLTYNLVRYTFLQTQSAC